MLRISMHSTKIHLSKLYPSFCILPSLFSITMSTFAVKFMQKEIIKTFSAPLSGNCLAQITRLQLYFCVSEEVKGGSLVISQSRSQGKSTPRRKSYTWDLKKFQNLWWALMWSVDTTESMYQGTIMGFGHGWICLTKQPNYKLVCRLMDIPDR